VRFYSTNKLAEAEHVVGIRNKLELCW